MKRFGKPHPESRLHVLCPFCGYACYRDAALTWCASCFVEYRKTTRGNIEFDTHLKTERFFWAKALAKAGGVALRDTETPE